MYSQNLGDAAIYECIRMLMGERGVHVTPVDLSGRRDGDALQKVRGVSARLGGGVLRRLAQRSRLLRRAYAFASWHLRLKKHLKQQWSVAVADVDAIVIGGGQLFSDVDFNFPLRLALVGRLSRGFKKPLAVFGCGVGHWGNAAKLLYRPIFARAVFVSVRDEFSKYRLAEDADARVEVLVHPDPAFLSYRLISAVSTASEDSLGINLLATIHLRNRVPELKDVTDDEFDSFWVRTIGLLSERFRISLLTNGDEKDFETISRVGMRARAAGYEVEVLPRAQNLGGLLLQLGSVSKLVCMRMHAGIIAFGMGGSVKAISWDRKVDDVWSAIGCPTTAVPATVLLGEHLPEDCIPAVRSNLRPEIASSIESAVDACIAAIDQAMVGRA
jgi:polysaccharide pyruvyl transferase WcaK-like protein